LVAVLDHFDGFGNLVGVEGDADHVEHAVFGGDDVALPIAFAAGVGHGGEFEAGLGGVVVAQGAVQVGFAAPHPLAVFLRGALLDGVLVADFHVVDAGGDASVVHGADDFVAELVAVDQAAVADGAIEHFQLGTISDPGGGFRHGNSQPKVKSGETNGGNE